MLRRAFHLQALEAGANHNCMVTTAVRNAVALGIKMPELRQLPAHLRAYLEQQSEAADGEAGPSYGSIIHLVLSAVITSRLPWDDEDVYLETVRANPGFHGRPFYDCVSIDNGEEEPWYAQLVALFQHAAKPCAFVRYFTTAAPVPSVRAPIAGLLARLGVVHLAWEKVNNGPSYGVIELSSIIKRECIVPDCSGGPRRERVRFLLNPFLWARNKY